MTLSLRFAAGSHRGMIREGNEDSGYAGPRLLAVADGMGGQAAGEVASAEVLTTMQVLDEDVPGTDPLTALHDTVQLANDRLRLMVEDDPQLEGMGTTLTALLWTGQRLGMAHIGDSRAYLLRDGRIEQITQDHTWVQRLVDEGRITEEERDTHPQRSLLMRALDGRGQVEPDLSIREVRAGDRYLLCSDGLSGVVSEQTIEDTLAGYTSPEQAIEELIQLALRGGGPDNITCIVADVIDMADQDTLVGPPLNDAPMVVGAVAEGPPTVTHHHMLSTPAGRASGLGRRHASGSGDDDEPPAGARQQRRRGGGSGRGRWGRRSTYLAIVLVVVIGGLYGGYRWTQSQYYVGEDGGEVVVFRGVNQSFPLVNLHKVYQRPSPAVSTAQLPQNSRTRVAGTIAVDSLAEARQKVDQLRHQADVCQLAVTQAKQKRAAKASQQASASQQATTGKNTKNKKKSGSKPSATPSASPTPSPSITFSAQDQALADQCDTSGQ